MTAPAPALVASNNADVGMEAGMRILTDGGSALDAVETVIRLVEDNPDDHTVGYGGFPNRDGIVELDALLMDGTARDAGAVGALRDYRAAITVARAVLERTEHVFIVGDGASELAAAIGLRPEVLLTEEAERVWRDGLATRTSADPERAGGTVDVLALDRDGNLVTGVSTSGWAWKHPGRVGDSGIVGAGGYADSRVAAAACTGWGELAMRAGMARMIVAAVEHGRPLADAAQRALEDLLTLDTGGHPPLMHVVVLGADGAHAGASTQPDRTYLHWKDGMPNFATLPRATVTG